MEEKKLTYGQAKKILEDKVTKDNVSDDIYNAIKILLEETPKEIKRAAKNGWTKGYLEAEKEKDKLINKMEAHYQKIEECIINTLDERINISLHNYAFGENNIQNIANPTEIKHNEYFKNVNEGKLFAFKDAKYYVEQAFCGNLKKVNDEIELAKLIEYNQLDSEKEKGNELLLR